MRKVGKFPKGADEDANRARSEGIKELFIIRKGELPMKTETPVRKIEPFVMMEVIEYAFDLSNANRRGRHPLLSEVYREKHDIRMISKSRKGRIEIEKILAAQGRDDLEEMGI